MKLLFLGTPEFAAAHLEKLVECGFDILGVITRPDKRSGRGRRMISPPVKVVAQKYRIPVFQPKKLVDLDFLTEKPDMAIVVAYGQLITRNVLDSVPLGFFNLHPSLLPKYRGASPINRVLENGESLTGLTIYKLNEHLDSGPIYIQQEIQIGPYETFDELYQKLMEYGRILLVKFLREFPSLDARHQNDAEATYAPKIKAHDLWIDFSATASAVKNKIRAYDSVPGAVTMYEGQRVKIYGVKKIAHANEKHKPGKILHIDRNGAWIATGGKGNVLVSDIQFPSKKRITFLSALNGRLVEVGELFSGFSKL